MTPEQLGAYKVDLVIDLNKQMTEADREVERGMDELSETFDERLAFVAEAGQKFHCPIVEERLEVLDGNDGVKEISLGETMTNLEDMIDQKSARLEELTRQHTLIQQQIVALAITILGSENVHLEGASTSNDQQVSTRLAHGHTPHPAKEPDNAFEKAYENAGNELDDLRNNLDALATQYGEENKANLKVRLIADEVRLALLIR